ncbi:MAG: ABC transporter substrate-binding protein [Rhodovarius sp.]|nr:ABC transporter substrate-binding protein [Rhodovarius sp.]MCX7931689.1 ABC transporter substrate-binding protein [Rhodovarius sp.]MDW8313674.1 ABC transporter substrate-binding protein [Rhodovarius sp.]
MKHALLAALLFWPLAVGAQTLTIAIGAAPTSIDPHFHNLGPNNALGQHIFEKLVERDSRARPQPALAQSWTAVAPTVWEFRLRPGVLWHDGRPFSAEDVLFTFQRVPQVPNSPGGFAGFLRSIAQVEVPEPGLLRIHTHAPNPLLPTELAQVAIIARHVAEGASTEDFNSGRAAIGTGPFRLISFRPGDRAELQRFDQHWNGPEHWARVSFRSIINDGARTAALLAGDVDIIDQVPTSDLARLRRDPRLSVSEIPSVRVMFLAPDFSRDPSTPPPGFTDHAGNPLPSNPLRDVRVRRAISLAMNREALAERIMEGTAVPTAQWLPEGAFGYDPTLRPPPFDPEAARRLLAEAGYPDGFRVVLHTPNDRWPNDARMAQAAAQMMARIGIGVRVEAMPFSTFAARAARQEFGLRFAAWGSSSGEPSNFLINYVSTFDRARRTGASNSSRYSNPELDALVQRAAQTMDDAEREQLWFQATRMVAEDLPVIPLVQLINTWAMRRGLVHDPRMDERTVAMGIRPAVMR